MRRASKASKDKRLANAAEVEEIPPEIPLTASYVGSIEHKTYASPAGDARPRGNASKCPRLGADRWPDLTEALRAALRRGVVGSSLDPGGYPRYAWGKFEGAWYEARHLSVPQGGYKAYPVETFELPDGAAERFERGWEDE